MKFASIFILAIAIQHCNKSKNDNPAHLDLKQCGNYVTNGETTRLCFEKVLSDSRCPANVVCVWEGTAVAQFTFHKNEQAIPITLATRAIPGQYSKDTIIAGYRIEFIHLLPYPGTTADSANSKANAEVKVTRL